MTATLIILAAAIVAFVSNRIPLGIVAIGVAVSLWATGRPGPPAGDGRLR